MLKKEKIIVTCGEFDPLDANEIRFLQRCKKKGDWLAVGIHSDWWMMYARGGFMQNYETRREIVSNLRCVDEIFLFNDSDGTVCQLLKLVKICYPDADITYVSDMDMHNMPETKIRGITFETLKQEIVVTKFVGKFRKNKDYSDDYDYARNFLHNKKRRGEHAEVKKLKNHEYEDSVDIFDEKDWPVKY